MNAKVKMSQALGRAGLKLKKYSPEILMGLGIAGGITASVMGAKATLKLEGVVDTINSAKTRVTDTYENSDREAYSDKDKRHDLTVIYTQGVMEIVKLYGPSVSLGLGSIVCILSAHGIMRKRYAAVAVAYNSLEKTFADYRDRVKDQFGEEVAEALRNGIYEVEETDSKTGKKVTKHTIDGTKHSMYARFFDEFNPNWTENPEYNMMFLKSQQQWLNDKLQARGHVFLNEVYDALGMERSPAGAVVGWTCGIGGSGDEFIDFGIYDAGSDAARDFVNGFERSILLDFNVDGVIYEMI